MVDTGPVRNSSASSEVTLSFDDGRTAKPASVGVFVLFFWVPKRRKKHCHCDLRYRYGSRRNIKSHNKGGTPKTKWVKHRNMNKANTDDMAQKEERLKEGLN